MSSAHLMGIREHLLLVSAGIIFLILGIFWGRDQPISWAAPEQNPLSQTIPPRPPTPEPEPTPVNPPSGQPSNDSSTGKEKDNRYEHGASPVELPEPISPIEETEESDRKNNSPLPPTPSSSPHDRGNNSPLLATPPPDHGLSVNDEIATPTRPTPSTTSSQLSNSDQGAISVEQPATLSPARRESNLKLPIGEAGSLLWLYLLGLGLGLMLTGIFLVKRA